MIANKILIINSPECNRSALVNDSCVRRVWCVSPRSELPVELRNENRLYSPTTATHTTYQLIRRATCHISPETQNFRLDRQVEGGPFISSVSYSRRCF